MKILVINAGSSSLKYQLMDPDSGEVFAKGLCERIGIDGRLTHKIPSADAKYEFEVAMPTHAEAIQAVIDALLSKEHGVISSMSEIDAVGPPCGPRWRAVLRLGEDYPRGHGRCAGVHSPGAAAQPRQHHRNRGL